MKKIRKQSDHPYRCSVQEIKRLAAYKKIIVYGYNPFFLGLCERKHLERYITRILDNNSHIWGQTKEIYGKKFEIENPENIKKCSGKDSAIVIIAPYFELLYRQLSEINPEMTVFYYRTKEDRLALRYDFLFKKGDTKNIILFRSGKNDLPLFDVTDNAKALYDYMISRNYQNKYKMVWVVKDEEHFRWLKSVHTDVVSYEWEESINPFKAIKYAYYVHYAKYCFFTDDCYWMRNHSENQILVSLWHGCGFKGRWQKTEPTGPHYDYMTVNSKFYAELHRKMYGCREEQMLITGLPKQDLLFDVSSSSFFEKYRLDKNSKIIFWLPTFRRNVHERLSDETFVSDTGLALFDKKEKLDELNRWLADKGIYLFIKPHPSQRPEDIRIVAGDNIILVLPEELTEEGIHINTLLGKADALISDYSSVAVDYMLLDRPIGFVISDMEEYRKARGFAFEPIQEYLPGKEIRSEQGFYDFLQDVLEEKDTWAEKRRRLMPLMHQYTDGGSCERILNKLGLAEKEKKDEVKNL